MTTTIVPSVLRKKVGSFFKCLIFLNISSFMLMRVEHEQLFKSSGPSPEVIKLFMLNSAEHEIYPAHKC